MQDIAIRSNGTNTVLRPATAEKATDVFASEARPAKPRSVWIPGFRNCRGQDRAGTRYKSFGFVFGT